MDILHAIGNTSLVRLRSVVPRSFATIHAKLEWENPTGSLKDRMALAVISRAEADGRLKPGDRVVEYTGGSTGTTAVACNAGAQLAPARRQVQRGSHDGLFPLPVLPLPTAHS